MQFSERPQNDDSNVQSGSRQKRSRLGRRGAGQQTFDDALLCWSDDQGDVDRPVLGQPGAVTVPNGGKAQIEVELKPGLGRKGRGGRRCGCGDRGF